MGFLRATYRLPSLALVTALAYLVWIMTRLTGLVSRDAARACHFWVVRNWGRALCWILGIRIEANHVPGQGLLAPGRGQVGSADTKWD